MLHVYQAPTTRTLATIQLTVLPLRVFSLRASLAHSNSLRTPTEKRLSLSNCLQVVDASSALPWYDKISMRDDSGLLLGAIRVLIAFIISLIVSGLAAADTGR